MISCLKGRIAGKGDGHLVVMVGGIGLEVRVPAGTARRAPATGEEVFLHTHLHVRDDALQLYGFDTPGGRELFSSLMTVSGFGAGKALSVLSAFSPEEFAGVIGREDADALTIISGVGKKGAMRLILEMKDKVEPGIEGASTFAGEAGRAFFESIEGLVQLGYSRAEAQAALKDYPVGQKDADAGRMIQFALKKMRR